jgi:hypothetical protein
MNKSTKLPERILETIHSAYLSIDPPLGIQVMRPTDDPTVLDWCRIFYEKRYAVEKPRTLLLGINPGRFGAGQTGIPFTDPINLERYCGISNDLPKRHEISSQFIYELIQNLGGLGEFCDHYLVSSVYPLGLLRNGKNFNYYDDPKVLKQLEPQIIDHMEKLIGLNVKRNTVFSIGKGKNLRVLRELNSRHKWFEHIDHIPHPRWIMQYRRRRKDEYIDEISVKLKRAIDCLT